MTDPQKISHLLRRFGYGASAWELALYEPLGVQGTIDRLIDYDKVDEGFGVSPWEFAFEEGKDEMYFDPPRFAGWWVLRMLMTQRPLEQKLTLFWHNHFAASGDKVGFGPAMLTYIETLRTKGTGKFGPLLNAVAKEPAMLKYLDGDTNEVGHPNENFAREVMELFTMGQGNYSEADVKDAARAFTGWAIRYLFVEPGGEKIQETAKASVAANRPMLAFCVTPSLHDDGTKTVLGQTGPLDGNQVLDILAKRPETALRITAKLWKFFASPDLSKRINERLAAKFTETQGDTRTILREMTKIDEFWEPRTEVKSPCEFVVGTLRSMKLHDILSGMHTPTKLGLPAAKPLRDTAGLLVATMYSQGMLPMFPPNVSGWEWGTAWISSANMIQRARFGDMIMGVGQTDQGLAAYLGQQVAASKPATSAEAITQILAIFDAELPPEKQKLLQDVFEKSGGVASLASANTASASLSSVLRPLFSSPEYQMF